MGRSLEAQIRILQEHYWSDADPDGRGFVALADAYRRTGKFREALRILRDGLARHPDYASGHVVMGWVHLDEGDPAEAEASFRSALEVDPGNVAGLTGLGGILQGRDRLEEALAVFQEVIRLDPTDSERHVRVLDLREQVEARRAAAARASADGPAARPWDDPEAAARDLDWDRASVQEDSSSAEEDLLPAPESEPEPWASRKEEWLSRQEPGAVAPVESEAGPLSGLGFVDHPGLLWVAKDGEGAPAGPEDVLATRTLGELYLSQGLPRKAEEVYAGLVARDPGNRALEARLSEIRDLLGGRPAGHVQELSAEVETPAEEAPPELVAPVEGAALAAATPATEAAPGLVLPVVGPPAHLALPVAELAPASILLVEDLAPARLLPIEELAPALVVPVGELAPELPVFLSAPAPDTRLVADSAAFDFPTPSGSAAQPQRGDEATPTEDHVLDAFEIWLKGLE